MLLSKIMQLTRDIKNHRRSLNQLASQKGLNSKEVLMISKNLNKEINELQQFLPQK